MDFSLSKEEVSVAGISSCFGDNYWLKRDRDVGFPQEFVTALAQNGWLGICLPEEYGAGPRHLCAGLMCAPSRIRRGERGVPSSALYRRKNEKEQGRNKSWRIGSKPFW